MTDIDNLRKPVTHLKMVKQDDGYEVAFCPRCEKAAEEIERLRASLTKTIKSLQEIVDFEVSPDFTKWAAILNEAKKTLGEVE